MADMEVVLQGPAATANGNGANIVVAGFLQAQQIEIQETAGGTVTATIEGSFDGSTWYAAGYQQVDAVGSPSRSVTAISVLASSKHVYQVLDPYPQIRCRLSSISSATVTAKLYAAS